MGRLFNMDNRLFRTLDKLADLLWLNILWMVTCIPIITIGASTTALYYTAMKIVRNEESYLTKNFFHSFKQNFIQATVMWILAVVVAAVLFIDILVFREQEGAFYKVASIALYAMCILYILIMVYAFPLLSRFENTTLNIIRNALLLSAVQIPQTLLIIFMIVIPYGVVFVVPYATIVLILFGGSGTAYATSYIFNKIFEKLVVADTNNEKDSLEEA